MLDFHLLGLDHPNNEPNAEWHNTYDTVMSYNDKSTGSLTPYYTDIDLKALQEICQ